MASGRLTRQDRQSIAQGLADGLAYAQIARRLDRATSTITREVLRNGGPGAYHAEVAHRESRTRRTGLTPPQRAAPEVPEPVAGYELQLTSALMAAGLTRLPARVLSSLLVTDSGAKTAAELARHLRVSPASVSRAVAFLHDQALLRRERDHHRRERYVVDDGIWLQSTLTSARTNAHVSEVARRAADALGAQSRATVRLAAIAGFLDLVSDSLTQVVDRARAAAQPDRRPPG